MKNKNKENPSSIDFGAVGHTPPKVLKQAKQANRVWRKMGTIYKAKQFPDNYSIDLGVCWMCYDSETKILSENGWKLFSELQPNEKVATLNKESTEIEYYVPDQLIRYPYKGLMYAVETRTLSLRVIPKHNLFVRLRGEKDFQFRQASEVYHKRMEMKTDGLWKSSKEMDRNLLELLGYYISEGSHSNYQTKIAQKEGVKRSKIERCLERLGIHFGGNSWTIWFHDKEIESFLLKAGTGAIKKRIPREIFDLSKENLKTLLDALMLGDGNFTRTKGRAGNRVYITSSYGLAEDLQELLLKTGSSGKITRIRGRIQKFRNGIYMTKDYYKIVERKRNLTPLINSKRKDDSWINYEGMVYSVSVKNHIIYVKRNDKPVWSGNCWIDLTFEMLEKWRIEPYSEMKEHEKFCPLCGYPHWKGRIWYPFRFIRGYIGNPSSRYGIKGKKEK